MASDTFSPTGFEAKEKAETAAREAQASVKEKKRAVGDAEWDSKNASQKAEAMEAAAALPADEVAEQHAVAGERLAEIEERLAAKDPADETGKKNLVSGADRRQLNKERRAEQEKLEALGPIQEAGDNVAAREAAVAEAKQAAAAAAERVGEATEELAEAEAELVEKTEDAAKFGGMSKEWFKDQHERGSRAQEAALRAMHADLARLGADAPAGSQEYCEQFEDVVDEAAHHVDCSRCGVPHGIDRTPEAKEAVAEMLAELERLAKLPNEDGLSPQQIRDRKVGQELEKIRAENGKMMGVLFAEDDEGTIHVIRGFSGDIGGEDDVEGWAEHVPPGGSMKSANGVEVPLDALPDMDGGTPHGVCAAPKMIQEAHRRKLKPVAMAEAWYGDGSGVQPHGALVASCATCQSNLDVQLCNNYPT